MKKVILIPDSFKGSMSSVEACAIMERAIYKIEPDCEVVSVPVADGGEGSVDAFLAAMGGEKLPLTIQGPFGEAVDSFYGLLPDGTAVIEMAAAAGLPMVGDHPSAADTTTYGLGQLMLAAARGGCKKMVVGIGGSATNDGGAGAAAALGVRFFNGEGKSFVPVGRTLAEIASIDTKGLDSCLQGMELIAMCDVDNVLCGPTGAAAVFGPQKGADEHMVKQLDAGLKHFAEMIQRDVGIEVLSLSGGGAAGGLGAGMVALLGARLQMGIETVLDTVRFDELARDANLIISGEGRLDSQSLRGKVVFGVAKRARWLGVPLVAIVGDAELTAEEAAPLGVSAIFSTNRLAVPFSQAKQHSREDLAEVVENLMRFWKLR